MTKTKVEASIRRGKGRPSKGAPSVGREAVIAATRQLLKKIPPSKITRADLSREAGVDPGLVRYYFGDKSSLLTEVMLQIFGDLQARRAAATDASTSFRDRLRGRIRALISVLQENPYLHEMLLQRAVFGTDAGSAEIDSIRRDYTFNSLKSLSDLIADGVRTGECRPVRADFLYIAVIGMSEFAVTGFPLFGLLSGNDKPAVEVADEYAEFLADLIVGGLSPRE